MPRQNSFKKTSKRNMKPEEVLQASVVTWFNYNYPTFRKFLHGNAIAGFFMGTVIKTPTGTIFKKNSRLLSRIKESGANEDYPDITILVPKGGYHGFFLELKTEENNPILKDGSYSKSEKYKSQIEYGLALNEAGYFWEFGVGYNRSIELIKQYMSGKLLRDEFYFYIIRDDEEPEAIAVHKLGARISYLDSKKIPYKILSPTQFDTFKKGI